MLQPAVNPTLFPYTTLFRSFVWNEHFAFCDLSRLNGAQGGRRRAAWEPSKITFQHRERLLGPDIAHDGNDEDRKSTRLNSSHQIISYAVFCLKKKKKDDNNE